MLSHSMYVLIGKHEIQFKAYNLSEGLLQSWSMLIYYNYLKLWFLWLCFIFHLEEIFKKRGGEEKKNRHLHLHIYIFFLIIEKEQRKHLHFLFNYKCLPIHSSNTSIDMFNSWSYNLWGSKCTEFSLC